MDVGSFKPPHKGEGDYVVFSDLKGLFSAFDELKSKLISSKKDLDENNENDFLGRLLLGVGTGLGFIIMMAINRREKLKGMMNSIAQQP